MSDSSESSSLSGGLAHRRFARLTRHRPWLANSVVAGHDRPDSPSCSSSEKSEEEQEVQGCGVVAAVIAAARRFTSFLPVKASRRSSSPVYRSRLTEKQVRLGSLAAGTASVLCVNELATTAAQDPESGVSNLVGCSGGSSPSVGSLPAGWRFWSLRRKSEKPKHTAVAKSHRGSLVGARLRSLASRACRLPVRKGTVSALLKRPLRRFLPRKGKKVGFALQNQVEYVDWVDRTSPVCKVCGCLPEEDHESADCEGLTDEDYPRHIPLQSHDKWAEEQQRLAGVF